MEDKRNTVLITVDSLRADYCGFQSEDFETTPYLAERLKQDGVVFESAVSPGPSTHISMPAIFSGSFPSTPPGPFEKREGIRSHLGAHKTIPERISDKGYSTAGFTPNPFTSREFGYNQDWDYFQDYLDTDGGMISSLRSKVMKGWLNSDSGAASAFRFGMNMTGLGDVSIRGEDMLQEISKTVKDLPEPFFLWVFLLDTHWPYQPTNKNRSLSRREVLRANWVLSNVSNATPSENGINKIKQTYADTVRDVDDFVSDLTEKLSEFNPAFMLHADHGEAFGEHGHFKHPGYLYQEHTHVPLVMWNVDNGSRINRPISLAEIPNILTNLTRSDGSVDWKEYTSKSAVSTTDANGSAVTGEDWKLYSWPDKKTEFYHLKDDQSESDAKSVSDSILTTTAESGEWYKREVESIYQASGSLETDTL